MAPPDLQTRGCLDSVPVKRLQRSLGSLLWGLRPHGGTTAFLASAYQALLHPPIVLSNKLAKALLTALAFAMPLTPMTLCSGVAAGQDSGRPVLEGGVGGGGLGPKGLCTKKSPTSPGGGDPSVLDANYPPQLTVGPRPLGGGDSGEGGVSGRGAFWEGRLWRWGAYGAHWLLGFIPLTTNCWPEAPLAGGGGGVVGVLGPVESPPPVPTRFSQR